MNGIKFSVSVWEGIFKYTVRAFIQHTQQMLRMYWNDDNS